MDKACPKDLCIALLHLYISAFFVKVLPDFTVFFSVFSFRRTHLPGHAQEPHFVNAFGFFFISRSCFDRFPEIFLILDLGISPRRSSDDGGSSSRRSHLHHPRW